ncbi:MAG: hypothetical protein M3133_07340 [Actinomycetota bacterium]|nr:hypothetical protein [Actinomycetota bacterium]
MRLLDCDCGLAERAERHEALVARSGSRSLLHDVELTAGLLSRLATGNAQGGTAVESADVDASVPGPSGGGRPRTKETRQ